MMECGRENFKRAMLWEAMGNIEIKGYGGHFAHIERKSVVER